MVSLASGASGQGSQPVITKTLTQRWFDPGNPSPRCHRNRRHDDRKFLRRRGENLADSFGFTASEGVVLNEQQIRVCNVRLSRDFSS